MERVCDSSLDLEVVRVGSTRRARYPNDRVAVIMHASCRVAQLRPARLDAQLERVRVQVAESFGEQLFADLRGCLTSAGHIYKEWSESESEERGRVEDEEKRTGAQ